MSDAAAPNALINESSPYLRQHARNPVRWLPWGEAAFAEARRRQVPVLVSIGYSTCHWCHVMAHECFEDRTTAELMNDALVCIKVDREEHPEVDEIYMDAVQAMTGHGGWPLNAFTDHAGRPFFTCTYVPRPSWQQLIGQIGEVWSKEPERLAKVADEVLAHLQQEGADGGAMNARVWSQLDGQLKRIYDPANPGYAFGGGKAPKFPSSQLLPVLLASGKAPWIAQAEAVLEAMQDAGIHDRVGGGFHRYSVDAAWRLPHFEKMLYDNAQLMGCYARAGVQLARADFLRTAVNTGDYLLRDLRIVDAGGGFAGLAAAEDADDPDGEGSFYAWSPAQLAAVLGADDAARLAREWDIRAGEPQIGHGGHPEPVISHIPHPRGADLTALAPGGDVQALRLAWEPLLPRLRAVRDRRPRPGRDDKLITDLNALALEGFAALGRFTGEERFVAACRDLVAMLADRHTADGLLRLPKRTAYITDYGHLVSGLTAAFDLLGDPALIAAAAHAADEAITRLRADDGGFYTTPAGRGDLVRRSREQTDNAYPSGQNALAVGLMRLWNVTGLGRWRAIAEGIFAANASAAQQAPTATATLLSAWRQAERGHFTAVVGGDPADQQTIALLAACRRSSVAGLGIVPVTACREQPWACLEGRRDLARPQALICVGTVCLAPAFTADEVAVRLAEAAKA